MAAIAGATLAAPSCGKTIEPAHHDTTYVFGWHYWDELKQLDKIAASADSVLVDHVILQSDGKPWGGSTPTLILRSLNVVINAVPSENQYKIRGAGILDEVGMGTRQERTIQDSIKLAQMGFKFGKIYYVK